MYNEGMILLNIVILLSVVFISMTLHEVMHGLVAYKLGDDTAKLDGRLTLNPFKHIDPIMTIALPLVLMLRYLVVLNRYHLTRGVWVIGELRW